MRRTLRGLVGTIAVILAGGLASGQTMDSKVKGRVVDEAGKPVAGVDVATFWIQDEAKGPSPYKAETTDADGRFTLRVQHYGRDAALLGMTADRKRGGLVVYKPKEPAESVEITLGPLVRVHARFSSPELGRPIPWINAYLNVMPGTIRIASDDTREQGVSLVLPPGEYSMNAYGSDVKGINKPITLKADQPDLDLGTIDLASTIIAKHVGKTPPPWSQVDSRNAKKDLKLDDLRGKWVLVDFWGHWCGPCVAGLAETIDFYEDHAADRDKFEIVAFHDATAKDFEEMDSKLTATRRDLWRGRDLPFPVLLDTPATVDTYGRSIGKTILGYGIDSYPTQVLIDPDGKLVGVSMLSALESKLPPIPMAKRAPKALDRDVALGIDSIAIGKGVEYLSRQSRLPIRFDEASLKAAGVTSETVVPLTLTASLSLRSFLDLMVGSYGLTVVADDKGLVVTRATGPAPEASVPQKASAERIAKKLQDKVSYDFRDATLPDLLAFCESTTRETFVLDPAGRTAGAIDSKATVDGSAKEIPLGEALAKLLKPLGLIAVVKDEAVVISAMKVEKTP